MAKYVTEFIGTFFLVFTIGLVVVGGSPMGPLAIGAVLMVMVYMGGHVSGAHYNPAVSVSLVIRGALKASELVPYIIAQVAGAVVAALAVKLTAGQTFAPATAASASTMSALMVEILFTFALCLVVMNVATSKKTEGNSYYGLAIGFTIAGAAFAGGPISGGAFNPAVGLGPILVHAGMGGGGWSELWLYIVGPVIGGILAAMVFKMQEADV